VLQELAGQLVRSDFCTDFLLLLELISSKNCRDRRTASQLDRISINLRTSGWKGCGRPAVFLWSTKHPGCLLVV
jgi:hypothetical protein